MLADCHIHMVLDGADWKAAIARHRAAPDPGAIRQVLESYRRAGFSYLRDGGDRWGVGKAAREMARQMGIVYKTPLAPLCKLGHYGSFIGLTFAGEREFAALVENHRREGADFIKIMISGLMDFSQAGALTEPSLPGREIAGMIRIAHEAGFSVMAHANGPEAVIAAAQAGVDSVEHGAYLNEEALAAMKEMGTVWVPTLSTIGNLLGKNRFPDRQVEKILDSALENVARFASLGGLLAPGTDAGAWAVPHAGKTEFAWLEKALGEQTMQQLAAGTQQLRRKF